MKTKTIYKQKLSVFPIECSIEQLNLVVNIRTILTDKEETINAKNITKISSNRSILGRLFGYGNIIIELNDDSVVELKRMGNYQQLVDKIQEIQDEALRRIF